MAYIGKSPTGSGVRHRYVYTATGGETSLSGADDNSKTLKFTDGEYVDVHLNGVLLVQGTDYGVGTANTISSLSALAANDVVEITVYDVYNVAKINSEAMRNRWYFTATGGETAITTTEVPGLSFNANAEIEVRLNGVSLQQGVDFNTTTANQVGGLAALTAGQVVEIIHYADFQLADTVSKAAGGTFTGDVTFDNNLNVGTIKDEAGTNTAMTINSSGVMSTGQYLHQTGLPMVVVNGNSDDYINTTPIQFPVTKIDRESGWDGTNHKYVVPYDGVYNIQLHMALVKHEADGSSGYPRLRKNGVNFAYTYVQNNNNLYSNANIIRTIELEAGDEIDVTWNFSSTKYYSALQELQLSIFLVG